MKHLYILSIICFLLTLSCSIGQDKTTKISGSNIDDKIVVGEKLKLFSDILGEEKEIYVALPPKYEEGINQYPVIFTLEAEFLFEPIQNIAKTIASRSKMPQSIVIGLANGSYEKRYDHNYERWNGKPKQYLEFFEKELIPFIESRFRANSNRTIIGLSPTNGFLFEAFLTDSELFSNYIALAASLEWPRIQGVGLIDEINEKLNDPNYPKRTLYIGRAKADLDKDPEVRVVFDRAIEKLQKTPVRNVKCIIDIIPNEEHYLMSLVGSRNALAHIYPTESWGMPSWKGWDKNANYAERIKRHYDNLSEEHGFDIYPLQNGHNHNISLSGLIYNAKRWGQVSQVIELSELATGYYPNSSELNMTLAEAYGESGQSELAIKFGEKAVQLAEKYHLDEKSAYKDRLRELRR